MATKHKSSASGLDLINGEDPRYGTPISTEASDLYKKLKNGWDMPEGEIPDIKSSDLWKSLRNGIDPEPGERIPLTGRKRELARAYELLELESPGVPSDMTMPQRRYAFDGKIRNRFRTFYGARVVSVITVIVVCICAWLWYGPPYTSYLISDYRDVSIEIEGLADETFTVTPAELAAMHKTRIKEDVHQGELIEGELPELGIAYGPTVETFLKKYGYTLDDIRSMKVYRENGISDAYVRSLHEKTIVMSIANGRQQLGEREMPLRIGVDGEDPGEWTGWIRKIVFVTK